MSTVREQIREARSALVQGKLRRAVQLCEQARANERLSDAQLVEVFALLGCAHVGLGEHETALAFLRRAERTPETFAAASEAYDALELEGDPAEVFERDDERRRARRRRRIGWLVGALVALPFVVLCAFCLVTGQLAGPLTQAVYGPQMERIRAAQQAGEELGRRGTVATCESVVTTDLAACSAEVPSESEMLDECFFASVTFHGCLSSTSGWDEYCAAIPPLQPFEAARLAMERRCAARAGELGLEGERGARFNEHCGSLLGAMPFYCADPEARPRAYDALGYDEYDDFELYEYE